MIIVAELLNKVLSFVYKFWNYKQNEEKKNIYVCEKPHVYRNYNYEWNVNDLNCALLVIFARKEIKNTRCVVK